MLTIDYTWHPIYPQKADEQLKQSCKYNQYLKMSKLINIKDTEKKLKLFGNASILLT